jgi:hypothetical protein
VLMAVNDEGLSHMTAVAVKNEEPVISLSSESLL